MKQSSLQKNHSFPTLNLRDHPGRCEVSIIPPPPWKAIHAALAGLLRQAFADLQTNSQERALHNFRKSAKRIRALIRMVRAGTSKHEAPSVQGVAGSARGVQEKTLGRLDEILHRLSQASTPVRDIQVQIGLLARMRKKISDPAEASLCRFLEERCRLQLLLVPALKPQVLKGLESALATLPDSLGKPLRLSDLDHALADAECKERKAQKKARSHPEATQLHTWRKRAKTLWYMTEFLQNSGFPSNGHDPKKLKKLTDLLGKDRDLALLGHSLDQMNSKAKKRLRERIAKKRARLQRKIFAKRAK